VPDDRYHSVKDREGNLVASILTKSESGFVLSFLAEDVPPIGFKIFNLAEKICEPKEGVVVADDNLLENDWIKAVFDQGNLVSLYDKKQKRNVLAEGGSGNRLLIFEDRPERESAWNIDLEYQNKVWPLLETQSVEVLASGGLKGVLRVTKTFNKSMIIQDITLYSHSPRMDFITTVHWHETEKMLKAAFEVDILSSKATYEIAFGAIERPTHRNTSWDEAKFEVPAHKWADLSEGGYGISLLNDCKYGYDIKDNVMRITLLRAPVYPDPVADKGTHHFVYSLWPHDGDWKQANVVKEGYKLNVPLRTMLVQGTNGSGDVEKSFLSIDRGHVVIDGLKQSEDQEGLIIRVYESIGARGDTTISTRLACKEVFECNLIEEKEEALQVTDGKFTFHIKPYEIKTFLIR